MSQTTEKIFLRTVPSVFRNGVNIFHFPIHGFYPYFCCFSHKDEMLLRRWTRFDMDDVIFSNRKHNIHIKFQTHHSVFGIRCYNICSFGGPENKVFCLNLAQVWIRLNSLVPPYVDLLGLGGLACRATIDFFHTHIPSFWTLPLTNATSSQIFLKTLINQTKHALELEANP